MSAWAAAGAAGASLVGDIMSGSNARDMARRQENFQREMSNTAHQREMADLRAAGLNPILTATGGAGAPTGSGSSLGPAPIDGAKAVNSALGVMQLKRENALADADIKNKGAQTLATTQSAKESLAREQGIKQATGIEANKFGFEKQWREMDKAVDYVSKGAGALGDVGGTMKMFRNFKNPSSAKGLTKP